MRPKIQFCLLFFLARFSRMRASITKSPPRRRPQAWWRGWPWCSSVLNGWQEVGFSNGLGGVWTLLIWTFESTIFIINNCIMFSSLLWNCCIHYWDLQYFNQKRLLKCWFVKIDLFEIWLRVCVDCWQLILGLTGLQRPSNYANICTSPGPILLSPILWINNFAMHPNGGEGIRGFQKITLWC